MAEQLDIPFLEITVEEFQHSWTRFELVSGAKEWTAAQKKRILPTLLRGKLVDIYMGLNDETRGDLTLLKKALVKQAGLMRDPLSAGQLFMTRHQLPGEKVNDFASELKKLFCRILPIRRDNVCHTTSTLHDGAIATHLSAIAAQGPI